MRHSTFYQSTAWRKLSKEFLISKMHLCERCRQLADVAHHKTHLTAANIANPAISLNPALLEALCLDCHNKEHFSAGGAVLAGLAFDDDGNLTEVPHELHPTVQRPDAAG
jgi:5-methylcytosine-specific restriction endonuclease McrA